jgi:hypothetical protein
MASDTRLNTASELWKQLDEAGIIVDTPSGSSQLVDTLAVVGATTLVIDAAGTFVDTDLIRIGSGDELEVNEIESGGGTTSLTLMTGLAYEQEVGQPVVEQEKRNIGHVAEGGVTMDATEETFEVSAATSSTVLVSRTTGVEQRIAWPGLNWSMRNAAIAVGMDEDSDILGTGVAADPFVLRWIADQMNSFLNCSLYFQGVREDDKIFEVRGWNVKFDLNRSATFARNAAAELPMGGIVKAIELRQWT